jgi:heme-degrading monooxygenase HmoA
MQTLEEENGLPTLVIHHNVKALARHDYESWLKEIAREGQRFKGQLGANLIRPADGLGSYTIVVRFDSEASLLEWMESTTRQRLLQRALRVDAVVLHDELDGAGLAVAHLHAAGGIGRRDTDLDAFGHCAHRGDRTGERCRDTAC